MNVHLVILKAKDQVRGGSDHPYIPVNQAVAQPLGQAVLGRVKQHVVSAVAMMDNAVKPNGLIDACAGSILGHGPWSYDLGFRGMYLIALCKVNNLE
jgi:hypothetical protein